MLTDIVLSVSGAQGRAPKASILCAGRRINQFYGYGIMLDNLTSRLSRVVKTMRGEARLTEANAQEMLREVRLAVLEADVALQVVRDFVARVKESALGQEVAGSLNPGQALVGVVHKELTALMGGDLGAEAGELSLAAQPPAVILMRSEEHTSELQSRE